MNREQADAALARLHDEQQRIFASLQEVENSFGYQVLKGASLGGETERRWAETESRIAVLWRLYDAYLSTLTRADEVRARRNRPNDDDLAELATLLTGSSVAPEGAEIPLAHRTLLGPTIERMSIDVAVERMKAAYADVVAFVAAAEAAWNGLQPKLDAAEQTFKRLTELAARGAVAPRLDAVTAELENLRESVRTDPLSVAADTADAVVERLAAQLTAADQVAELRETHQARIAAVRGTIDALAAAEAEAGQARTVVVEKILTSGLPEIPEQADQLRTGLDELTDLAARGEWVDLAARANELDAAVADAGAALARVRENVEGLLARRDELRGRLQAYEARAARLGYAENAEITGLHDAARDLLWSAPCDLRRSTVALSTYIKAIT